MILYYFKGHMLVITLKEHMLVRIQHDFVLLKEHMLVRIEYI